MRRLKLLGGEVIGVVVIVVGAGVVGEVGSVGLDIDCGLWPCWCSDGHRLV
jgi:hypothetical protein